MLGAMWSSWTDALKEILNYLPRRDADTNPSRCNLSRCRHKFFQTQLIPMQTQILPDTIDPDADTNPSRRNWSRCRHFQTQLIPMQTQILPDAIDPDAGTKSFQTQVIPMQTQNPSRRNLSNYWSENKRKQVTSSLHRTTSIQQVFVYECCPNPIQSWPNLIQFCPNSI